MADAGLEGRRGEPGEVFGAFLRLGLTAFGGPIAHIGYFREAFVVRRRWLSEAAFAELVALCQFLPGPASSQVGFGLGLMRAGPLGALAAWAGFTLPSAALMVAFALAAGRLTGPLAGGLIHGLGLVAVAVVAQAVLSMARSLAPDAPRAAIAVSALAMVTALQAGGGQIGAIAAGALAGVVLRLGAARAAPAPAARVSRGVGAAALALYLGLLTALPAAARLTGAPGLAAFEAFYRSGALVFGGGHVVLPLLERTVVTPGWVSPDRFLAGYGAAQALPGPLFTFAAFLGASMRGPAGGLGWAAVALAGIFLPGLLVLVAALPFWSALRARPAAQSAIAGANAAVVGVLAAALYDPVWTHAVRAPSDFALAAAGFVALIALRAPPVLVVALGAAAGVVQAVV